MTRPEGRPDPAEYVLGLGGDEQIAAAEQAIASDPAFAAEVADWAARLAPLDDGAEAGLPPALWSGIEARLEEERTMPGIRSVASDAGVWEDFTKGVERKIVNQDPLHGTASYFLRLRAGAVLPAHDHPHEEHCVVLEGRLRIANSVFGPGSYQFAPEGLPHPPVTAETEALVFVQGPL